MTSVSSPSPPFKSFERSRIYSFPCHCKKRRGCLWSNPRRVYGYDQKLFVSSRWGMGLSQKKT
ncbi:hypothetical protein GW17_00051904 [Ensete ventricosum]|nr:hypothetical protein GW17_00051904 [Ensete ventricosum]